MSRKKYYKTLQRYAALREKNNAAELDEVSSILLTELNKIKIRIVNKIFENARNNNLYVDCRSEIKLNRVKYLISLIKSKAEIREKEYLGTYEPAFDIFDIFGDVISMTLAVGIFCILFSLCL